MSINNLSPINGLVLVGCGNMGFAMLRGWLAAGSLVADAVHVVEPAEPLRDQAASLDVNVHAMAGSLPAGFEPDIVIFAVKPQVMADVLPDYRRFAAVTTFVSIAAGISMEQIAAALGPAPIVRGMPNTPAAIGKGSTVIVLNGEVGKQRADQIKRLLSAGGAVHVVENEALIDAVTAISGSGPAYVFHFIESLADIGQKLGLPPEIALSLAKETVHGAGALAMERSENPAELQRQVTSPKGTTEAALSVLTGNSALRDLVGRAAEAAYRRAQELKAEQMRK